MPDFDIDDYPDPTTHDLDWDTDTLGSMADYATDDDPAVEEEA